MLFAGPGPTRVKGDGWFTSAISFPFLECATEPTTKERIESPDLAILLLGKPLSKFLQFPVDLQIITSLDIWISSSAFPKSEKSFKSASDLVPKERFQILISEFFFLHYYLNFFYKAKYKCPEHHLFQHDLLVDEVAKDQIC